MINARMNGARAGLIAVGLAVLVWGCSGRWPRTSCVAEGTLISTPRGPVPVQELGVGDEISSVDPKTGLTYAAKIVAVRSARRPCVLLSMDPGEEIQVTVEHPFLSPETSGYEPAARFLHKELKEVCRLRDEKLFAVRVQTCRELPGSRQVFDLTVDSPHHNFVANGFVVHNKTPLPPAVEVTGTWLGTWESTLTTVPGDLTLILDNTGTYKVTGTAVFGSQSCIGEGQVDGDSSGRLTANVTGSGFELRLEAAVQKDKMTGTFTVTSGAACLGQVGDIELNKTAVSTTSNGTDRTSALRFLVYRIDEDGVEVVGESLIVR
jgi:hypothetical protein